MQSAKAEHNDSFMVRNWVYSYTLSHVHWFSFVINITVSSKKQKTQLVSYWVIKISVVRSYEVCTCHRIYTFLRSGTFI